MEDYYHNLKKIREQKGMNYKKIAKKLWISKSFYWQIEHKKRKVYYDMAFKIAVVLDSKPDDLYYQK